MPSSGSPHPALAAVLAAAALLLAEPASGQSSAALPATQSQGTAVYLSGGVGADESAAIKAARDQYALSISFSARSAGHDVYLASLPVTIRDASGATVLDIVADGPYLLVQLPPGRYDVAATYAGVERKAKVAIAAGRPQRLALSWAEPAPAPGAPAASEAPAATGEGGDRADALPTVRIQGGVPYLSGGIGAEESQALKAASARYSLVLTLTATEDGHDVFIADVPVTVQDWSGVTVLDVIAGGPYLLVDLPPGRYRIRATYKDQPKSADANVAAGKTTRLSLAWTTAP